jgi:hypothetical protein
LKVEQMVEMLDEVLTSQEVLRKVEKMVEKSAV